MSEISCPSEPRFTAFVAIDWADRQHAFAWEDAATGRRQTGSIEHTPEAVANWVGQLLQRFGGGPIALALEQSRGALLAMLTHYEGLVIYAVNPAMVARLRQAFFPSGAKDDPLAIRVPNGEGVVPLEGQPAHGAARHFVDPDVHVRPIDVDRRDVTGRRQANGVDRSGVYR